VLCDSCCYFADVGRIRPTDSLRIGQIFAGLGTGMMQLCELASAEGLPLKRLSNVYSIEWEPSAVRYVMHLGNQDGYAAMTPTTMHTDFLSDTLRVDDLQHVHILFLTLVCAKFSSVNNGHPCVANDLADPDTRRTTYKCCNMLRRHKPAATIIVMENVMGWEKSESLALIMQAAAAGGYRELLRWKCRVNEDLGLPEHRDRFMLVLAHRTHAVIADESAQYQASLTAHCDSECENSIQLRDVFLDWQSPSSKKSDASELTLNDCSITAHDLERVCTLSLAEATKVTKCKQEIFRRAQEGVGSAATTPDGTVTCSSWYTGDLCNSDTSGWSSLHKTIGRIPTVLSSHGSRAIYCFHHSRDRFFLVPELMVARGFSQIPIMAGCDQFSGSDVGWSTLGWLVGGAAPPTAYRAILKVLWDLAPSIMRNPAAARPGECDLGFSFDEDDLRQYSMSTRFGGTYLQYPGSERWALRDFNKSRFVVTTDWHHVHVKDFATVYTKVKVPGDTMCVASREACAPGGIIHCIQRGLQRHGIDTMQALGVAQSSPAYVKTDMSAKRGNARGVGFVAQPGVRNRMWDHTKNKSGNKIGQCHFKGQSSKPGVDQDEQLALQQKYLSYLHHVQAVCNAADAVLAEHVGTQVCNRLRATQDAQLPKGTASHTYPAVQVGVNVGCTCHFDEGDCSEATWALLGKDCAMGLPECRTVLHFSDGDVCMFEAHEVMHCMIRVPPEMFLNACFSMYYNKRL
jgi:site-specific DNA-cytosine methylase